MPRDVYSCGVPVLAAAIAAAASLHSVGQAQQRSKVHPESIDRVQANIRSFGTARVIVAIDPVAVMPTTPTDSAQQGALAPVQARIANLASASIQTNTRPYPFVPYVAMTADQQTLDRLEASPDVAAIFEDLEVEPTLNNSTPLIGANAAWARGAMGTGWAVAVIDTGIDESHPFVSRRTVAEGCWDSLTMDCPGASSTAVGSGSACPGISCDHGTHVAGIVAGNGANAAVSFSGVAPGASLIPIRVFNSSGASASESDIDLALQYVYFLRNTVRIAAVNMSLGTASVYASYCDSVVPSTKAAIDQLRSAGIATVISSGNSYSTTGLSLPACISSAVSVGSTINANWGGTDTISTFSNRASFLSLLAPGEPIRSSIRRSRGSWAYFSGTSMAAPHVAGAWALLKQVMPTASVSDILGLLWRTGRAVTDTATGLTFSRIQIDAAMNAAAPPGVVQIIPFNFDGDGYKDLLLYNRSTGAWSVRLGTPSGQFRLGPSGGWSAGWNVYVAHFSVSAVDDLFLYNPITGVYFKVLNTGSGFSYFTQGWQPGFRVSIVDFNGDHVSDIFLYNPVTGTWFTCVSTGTGATGFTYHTGQWAANWQVLPADFNADGRTDLFLYSQVSGLYYKVIGVGDGTFAYTAVGVWALTWTPYIADLNGDGRSDVFIYDRNNGLWYTCVSIGDGTGGFAYTVGQWAPGWTIQIADFDGDGRSDLFLYNQTSGLWYVVMNTGAFRYFSGTWGAWSLTVADMNGDGKSDLLLYDANTRSGYQALATATPGAFSYLPFLFY